MKQETGTIEYRMLRMDEIEPALFNAFERHQSVTRCWRKENGAWHIRDIAFEERWGSAEYEVLCLDLRRTIQNGGAVFCALIDGRLKGFSAVNAGLFGKKNEYIDMPALHVSEESRDAGIGEALFLLAADWARKQGAKKLYISGHSAVETQAFYRAMGCREAIEYSAEHVAAEPCDCQLEYVL